MPVLGVLLVGKASKISQLETYKKNFFTFQILNFEIDTIRLLCLKMQKYFFADGSFCLKFTATSNADVEQISLGSCSEAFQEIFWEAADLSRPSRDHF